MFSKKSAESPPPARPAGKPDKGSPMASRNAPSTFSVLGSDLSITGNVKASADLHIDGSVEGDIVCTSLVQGETSAITGGIQAETARLAGTVKGSIAARELVILKSARIEGDVHYEALTIEQGAAVDGRFAPAKAMAAGREQPAPKAPSEGDEPRLSVAQ